MPHALAGLRMRSGAHQHQHEHQHACLASSVAMPVALQVTTGLSGWDMDSGTLEPAKAIGVRVACGQRLCHTAHEYSSMRVATSVAHPATKTPCSWPPLPRPAPRRAPARPRAPSAPR
eukprot:356298-Chlamydomonas_euryale.AAC.13